MATGIVERLQAGGPARPEIGPVVVGPGDRRAFDGESDLDPRARLARYRPEGAAQPQAKEGSWSDPIRRLMALAPDDSGGGRFHRVGAGELAEVPRIYVFVHGWVPGSRAVTEGRVVEAGTVPMAWEEDVANTVGRSLVEAYEPLLAALAQRDPQAAVLWYSWVDQSGTDTEVFAARGSLQYAAVNGVRLATALRELVGSGEPKVHLIGHSHGSVVASYASACLPRPPEHLTLLDCPEDWFSRAGGAAGLLGDVLPRLRPGRGPEATFIDSYASMFGRAYHEDPGLDDVVDVRLAPTVKMSDSATAASQAHHFPVVWYANTIADPDAIGGFAWSPLHGCDTRSLGSLYLASAKGRLAEVQRRREDPGEKPEQRSTVIDHHVHDLTRRAPDVAFMVTLPDDAVLLEYDLTFTRPGKGTRVDVAVNGRLVAGVSADQPLPASGRFVRVDPGRTTLQFRLTDPGVLSAASVGGIRVVQGGKAVRNLDDTAAMVRVAVISAAAGAVGALVLVGTATAAAKLIRRLSTAAGAGAQ
jgi:hypothetical protein